MASSSQSAKTAEQAAEAQKASARQKKDAKSRLGRAWFEERNRDIVVYYLIAVFCLELIVGAIAFFYGVTQAVPVEPGGPKMAKFPWVGWLVAAILSPVGLLLLLHLSGQFFSRALNGGDPQPGSGGAGGQGEEVPKQFQRFYAIVRHAPTIVILLTLIAMGCAVLFIDSAMQMAMAVGAALKPYILWILFGVVAFFIICYLGRLFFLARHRRMEQEYAYRREVLEKTGIVLVSKGSIPLNRGIEPLQAVDGGGYALPPGPAYTPEEAAADAAALEAGEKKGDAPAEDIVDVDPEDLGEAPKNTAAPRKDDVTDADVVVEDGKPRA